MLKLKTDEHGVPVMKDGKFVYIDDANNNAELELDPAHLYTRVRELTGENTQLRKDKTDAETAFKPFKDLGLTDAQAAKTAIDTVANIDAGKLMEAGKVEDLKKQIREQAQAEVATAQQQARDQIAAITAERDTLQTHLNNELIGGNFARSKFISEKVAVPVDMVQALFGPRFKVEDGKVVGYMAPEQRVLDPSDFSTPAAFDVALEKMIEAYPHKEQILRGNDSEGGGSGGDGKPKGGPVFKRDIGGNKQERTEAIRSRLPPELRGKA